MDIIAYFFKTQSQKKINNNKIKNNAIFLTATVAKTGYSWKVSPEPEGWWFDSRSPQFIRLLSRCVFS